MIIFIYLIFPAALNCFTCVKVGKDDHCLNSPLIVKDPTLYCEKGPNGCCTIIRKEDKKKSKDLH